MKKCNNCHVFKDDENFINENGKELKTCERCRKKARERSKKYYRDNLEKVKERHREYGKKYYYENIEKEKIRYEKYKENHKESILRKQKEYRELNRERGRQRGREYYVKNTEKEKISKKRYLFSVAKYKNHFSRLTIEEEAVCGEGGELLVRCAYCGKYYSPINAHVYERIRSLEGRGTGENRLYCSQICKDACDVYGVSHDPRAKRTFVERSSTWAKQVKETANYTCERCGATENLEAHHEIPVKKEASLVNEENNGVCLCHECHMKVHSEEGCTFVDLRGL